MNTIRFTLAALALSAASFAQAGEITDFAIEPSTRSRAEVQAEARMAPSTNEAWGGPEMAAPQRMQSKLSREQVRREATMATPAQRMAASEYYIGGM